MSSEIITSIYKKYPGSIKGWYIAWAEHINVCIVPLCLVSFMKRPALAVLGTCLKCYDICNCVQNGRLISFGLFMPLNFWC
jgi:hypothetical protein